MYGNTVANHRQDILNEMISVAQVSEEMMNQNSWIKENGVEDDFCFLNQGNHDQGIKNASSVEAISGSDEQFNTQKMVENLRWVGMSSNDYEKVL